MKCCMDVHNVNTYAYCMKYILCIDRFNILVDSSLLMQFILRIINYVVISLEFMLIIDRSI